MKKSISLISFVIVSLFFCSNAKTVKVEITPQPSEVSPLISPEIYGQFAEHLGSCIYGGIWVGESSDIPNTKGYRNDVLEALRELQIPVLRWPGGCFADEYHWRDGIGPREDRPTMVNSNWGGTVEDNSFGTHEFFDFCEILGIEPYLSANVGSGTVEEMAKWVEYITAPDGPMAKEREKNGRKEPWKLKYLGVGNESWGCGGSFLPEAYADVYRRYQTYCRNFGNNRLYKIASGASDYDYNWTDVLMKKAKNNMDGLSLHYYTVWDWANKGKATEFTPDVYYYTLGKALEIDDVIGSHADIMDKYDPEKRVGLLVDEWGTWWDVEPGTNPGHLYQQNTMRDAMVAALTLNVFHGYADRVRMANIAQLANVLQSMVLTNGPEMVVTPTYHVFRMYTPHQNGKLIPLNFNSPYIEVPSERSDVMRKVPMISATASEKDGKVTVSLVNTSLDDKAEIDIPLMNLDVNRISSAEILTSPNISDFNDFGHPETVRPNEFKGATVKKGNLEITLPAASIVTLTLTK
ncbi:MAG: alpha-N-arabinofuranosidase [Muribaculaceae bacterium]|nr:alpha-N-arabinofuranosidase [Muribaculaceae bacterium]